MSPATRDPAKKAPAKKTARAKAAPKTESTPAAAEKSASDSAPEAAPETPKESAAAPESVAPTAAAGAAAFQGKLVVLTGTLITMKRDEAQRLLVAAGARLGDSVTKQTDLLIYGERAGSKLAAAKKHNIALMTEAEMVAQLLKSPTNQASLGDAAQKIAEAEAEEKKRTAGLRAEIDAANTRHMNEHGMTLPQLLLKYFQIFAKRPDVFITNNKQGRPASTSTLLRLRGNVPKEWLALHSEIGALHFGWVFTKDKASRAEFSEGYNGGRIVFPDPETFRWWPRQDWQAEHFDFKEDALFDDFVNEGLTKLSYGPDEDRTTAMLIFDNANDCKRHTQGSIWSYLRDGARAGFTWYWQMDPAEFTDALFQASLPRDTPPALVEELLQKQGLSASEARGMRSWLGNAAVILLHQSLTAAGAERQKLAKRFPGANGTSKRNMDTAMVEQLARAGDAMAEAEWQDALAAHKKFLASGGSGGRWELFSVSGLPMCIYRGARATEGTQLVLRLKSIKGRSAKGTEISYADVSGACCDGVDFSGADLSHSVLTDSFFTDATFQGAKLQGADFSGARLHRANFQGADLRGADFEAADLTGADFRKAVLTGAKFPGAILTDAKG